MRIVFRADASHEIGTGHVMRSSVLAEEAIARGYECVFIGRIDGLAWVSSRITSLGFSAILEDERHFHPNREKDVLILDSYTLHTENKFIGISNWKCVLKISDKFTPDYEAHIELRPSLTESSDFIGGRFVLSGPKYILTRKEITKSSLESSRPPGFKVLVVGGGSDPFGFVKSMTSKILDFKLQFELHAFTNEAIASAGVTNVVTHPIGRELDDWARQVDLVITTASTSSLEFIAREVPVAVVCAVENQKEYYDQLGELGYVSRVGFMSSTGVWQFDSEELNLLLTSVEKRNALRNSTRGLIDLKGASRVINHLEHTVATEKVD